MKRFDINKHIGKTYGKLTVVGEAPRRGRRIYLKVKCECGVEKETRADGVIGGYIISCGCGQKLNVSKANTKHSLSRHPLYKTWVNIKGRCLNENATGYEHWGGRDIGICDEWVNDPEKFINWCLENGWEKGLQIDRSNNDKNYSPGNCHFITQQQNNCNTRLICSKNKSGFRGVSWSKQNNCYVTRVNYKSENIFYKGGFQSPKQAAVARDIFCIKNNIPLPLNFPELAINGPL